MKKKHTKTRLASLLIPGIILGLAACAPAGNDSTETSRKAADHIIAENQVDETESGSRQDNTADPSQKKTEYPLTIQTYGSDGAELEITFLKAPEKVLAVYQGSVETMLALGLEDSLVATAGLDNEVPDEQKTAFSATNYLDEFTPSLERVTMLEPDLIFSWGSYFGEKTLGDAKGWIDRGVNIYMNTNTHPRFNDSSYHKTLENEFTDILNIGKIFDVQDRAEAIVDDMRTTIENVLAQTSDLEVKPTALIIEANKDSFTNYGENSLGGDMLTKLGGVLANPDAPSIGKEDIIAANPDVIFVVYMPYSGDDPKEVEQAKLDQILQDEAYQSLDAVKNGRVVPIMLSEMYASATRTKDGIVTFAKGLYPELEAQQ